MYEEGKLTTAGPTQALRLLPVLINRPFLPEVESMIVFHVDELAGGNTVTVGRKHPGCVHWKNHKLNGRRGIEEERTSKAVLERSSDIVLERVQVPVVMLRDHDGRLLRRCSIDRRLQNTPVRNLVLRLRATCHHQQLPAYKV